MIKEEERLVTTSVYVQRVAPREWEDFMAALNEHCAYLMNDLLIAVPPALETIQGRARGVVDLCSILKNAPQQMQKIEAQKSGRKQ
jgi:hypothetical protein